MVSTAVQSRCILVEGRTTYKVYFSDMKFHTDYAELRRDYRACILAENEMLRFLKKYQLEHDPAEVAVVSYTKIEKENYDPFLL